MVYCTKCGAQNDDDADHCSSCGASLKVARRERRGWEEEIEVRAEEFGERAEKWGRNMEDECFGLPGGSSIVGILFGLMIVLLGVRELLGWTIDFGPFVIIIVGVLILAGALYQQNKRKR
jgi:tetrahydromethanopterin S-methyltransferase subunit E